MYESCTLAFRLERARDSFTPLDRVKLGPVWFDRPGASLFRIVYGSIGWGCRHEHSFTRKANVESFPLDSGSVSKGCRGGLVPGPEGRVTRWRGLLHGPQPAPSQLRVETQRDALRLLDRKRWTITREDDVEMGDDWVPSPDIAVLRGSFDALNDEMLKGLDVALVVEVSHKTYTRDRNLKLPRYAHNKIPVYWIVSIERSNFLRARPVSEIWRRMRPPQPSSARGTPCRLSWTGWWSATWMSRKSSRERVARRDSEYLAQVRLAAGLVSGLRMKPESAGAA